MNKITDKKEEELLSHIIELVKLSAQDNSELLKARYLQELFYNIGFKDAYMDCSGNLVAKLSKEKSKKSIVICANLDSEKVTGDVSLTFKNIVGQGIGEAGVALYSLVFLAELLKEHYLENSIYFIATSGAKQGNKGLTEFLNRMESMPIGLVNIEGIGLGEVNKKNVNLIRYEMSFKGDGGHAWKDIGGGNPIFAISGTICQLKEIIKNDNIVLNIASVNSGSSFDMIPEKGSLSLDIRGFDIEKIEVMADKLRTIAKKCAEEEEVVLELNEVLRIVDEHPVMESALEKTFVAINEFLDISTYSSSSCFEIAPALSRKIDAVSVGLSEGGKMGTPEEYVSISSIYKGMNQIYKAILKYDKD